MDALSARLSSIQRAPAFPGSQAPRPVLVRKARRCANHRRASRPEDGTLLSARHAAGATPSARARLQACACLPQERQRCCWQGSRRYRWARTSHDQTALDVAPLAKPRRSSLRDSQVRGLCLDGARCSRDAFGYGARRCATRPSFMQRAGTRASGRRLRRAPSAQGLRPKTGRGSRARRAHCPRAFKSRAWRDFFGHVPNPYFRANLSLPPSCA